jgi:uncharacterized phage-associated protein
MKIVVKSSLDVALWFNDRAYGEGEYLQPQKLHRLMYLAFAYFTVAYPKQKLMPATFVTDEFGPVEPTVFHALAYGVPNTLEQHGIPAVASEFLDSIWGKFGSAKAEHLNKKVAAHAPVEDAMSKGSGQEITHETMVAFYSSELAAQRGIPAVDKVMRPRVLRSAAGKVVTVNAWKPKPLEPKG